MINEMLLTVTVCVTHGAAEELASAWALIDAVSQTGITFGSSRTLFRLCAKLSSRCGEAA
jgi:hypothetical protein